MRGLGHGQVWWADLDKIRPVLILTRSTVAPHLSRVLVAPITTVFRDIPSEVVLDTESGVVAGSVASLDNVQLVPVSSLLRRAGRVHESRWREVCEAMAHTIGCS